MNQYNFYVVLAKSGGHRITLKAKTEKEAFVEINRMYPKATKIELMAIINQFNG